MSQGERENLPDLYTEFTLVSVCQTSRCARSDVDTV